MNPSRVLVLPEAVANLIAAGEVVERPASAVKELVENALDAGARGIEVEVRGAGTTLLRVSDDGCGMTPSDAILAFQRHATSKLASALDLDRITTLGFRGEALPSLAAVARVILTTRPAEASVGWRIMIEGGEVKEERETACAPGTTVEVHDLFYNTPARRKFLKSPATEQSRCLQAVEWAALAHPGVRFRLEVDGREAFTCPPADGLEDRLASLYGGDRPDDLRPVAGSREATVLTGLIAGPAASRPTRQGMFFFINQRPVEHRGLAHAVLEAYRHLLPPGRFPVCYLFLTVPPQQVDVNVHPAKREVRLRDEHGVHDLVLDALRRALGEGNLTASPAGEEPAVSGTYPPTSSWSRSRVEEASSRYLASPAPFVPAAPAPVRTVEPAVDAPTDRLIGQVGRTYIAAQDADGFYLVDQHAVHERWLYERLRGASGPVPRQALLLPLTFELAPARAALLAGILGLCGLLGLEIEPFGRNTFVIRTHPQDWGQGDLKALVNELLDGMAELDRAPAPEDVRERALQLIACHGAVKAGDRLQPEVMRELLVRLEELPSPKTCPHGRPLVHRLTWRDLDRLFKRA